MAIHPIVLGTLMLAVFMAKVFVYLKTHQQNYRYLMFQNEASSDRKTHDAQPFYGLSVFGLRLCEVALKVLDLTETARSRSPPSYQRATDGFRVRPANLLLRRSRGRMFQMNIWAESCYKCPTAGRLLTL